MAASEVIHFPFRAQLACRPSFRLDSPSEPVAESPPYTNSCTYTITITAANGSPERNLWIGRLLTPTINRAINAATQKATAKAVAHCARRGRLDKPFRVED